MLLFCRFVKADILADSDGHLARAGEAERRIEHTGDAAALTPDTSMPRLPNAPKVLIRLPVKAPCAPVAKSAGPVVACRASVPPAATFGPQALLGSQGGLDHLSSVPPALIAPIYKSVRLKRLASRTEEADTWTASVPTHPRGWSDITWHHHLLEDNHDR